MKTKKTKQATISLAQSLHKRIKLAGKKEGRSFSAEVALALGERYGVAK